MKTGSKRGRTANECASTHWFVGLSILLLLGVSAPAQAVPCGPGPHWVDNCPRGTDRFLSEASHGVVVFDPEDGGLVVVLPLMTGVTRIFRSEGTEVPDHHIDTEMVSLNLEGGGLTLRAGARFDLLPSVGRITELPADPLIAHSFFDVFFEIFPIPIFGPLHNNVACRMTADIDRVHPFDFTYSGCHDLFLSTNTTAGPLVDVPLFDANQIQRARLTTQVFHTVGGLLVIPEPPTLILLLASLIGLAAAQVIKGKRIRIRLTVVGRNLSPGGRR